MSSTSWKPTRKWLATQCTATTAVVVSWVNAGAWNKSLTIATIGLVSQAAVGYLVSNGDASAPASSATDPNGKAVTPTGARSTTA
jgi:hypothetical protein